MLPRRRPTTATTLPPPHSATPLPPPFSMPQRHPADPYHSDKRTMPQQLHHPSMPHGHQHRVDSVTNRRFAAQPPPPPSPSPPPYQTNDHCTAPNNYRASPPALPVPRRDLENHRHAPHEAPPQHHHAVESWPLHVARQPSAVHPHHHDDGSYSYGVYYGQSYLSTFPGPPPPALLCGPPCSFCSTNWWRHEPYNYAHLYAWVTWGVRIHDLTRRHAAFWGTFNPNVVWTPKKFRTHECVPSTRDDEDWSSQRQEVLFPAAAREGRHTVSLSASVSPPSEVADAASTSPSENNNAYAPPCGVQSTTSESALRPVSFPPPSPVPRLPFDAFLVTTKGYGYGTGADCFVAARAVSEASVSAAALIKPPPAEFYHWVCTTTSSPISEDDDDDCLVSSSSSSSPPSLSTSTSSNTSKASSSNPKLLKVLMRPSTAARLDGTWIPPSAERLAVLRGDSPDALDVVVRAPSSSGRPEDPPHMRIGGYCAEADPRLLPVVIFALTGIRVVSMQLFRAIHGLVTVHLAHPEEELPIIAAALHQRALMTRDNIYVVADGTGCEDVKKKLADFAADLPVGCRQPRRLMTVDVWIAKAERSSKEADDAKATTATVASKGDVKRDGVPYAAAVLPATSNNKKGGDANANGNEGDAEAVVARPPLVAKPTKSYAAAVVTSQPAAASLKPKSDLVAPVVVARPIGAFTTCTTERITRATKGRR